MLLRKDLSETQETLKSFFRVFSDVFSWFYNHLIIRLLNECVFFLSFPKSLFLVFWQMWTMARRFFFDRRAKTHNSLLFANPVAVPRLPDAIYLMRLFSHGFKNPRLFAFGLASFRRLFLATRLSKPSGRRRLSSPWNMEVSIIKVVWKTGIWIAGGLLSLRIGFEHDT